MEVIICALTEPVACCERTLLVIC